MKVKFLYLHKMCHNEREEADGILGNSKQTNWSYGITVSWELKEAALTTISINCDPELNLKFHGWENIGNSFCFSH